jgi:hypothetical protein
VAAREHVAEDLGDPRAVPRAEALALDVERRRHQRIGQKAVARQRIEVLRASLEIGQMEVRSSLADASSACGTGIRRERARKSSSRRSPGRTPNPRRNCAVLARTCGMTLAPPAARDSDVAAPRSTAIETMP